MIDEYYVGDIYENPGGQETPKGLDKKNYYVGIVRKVTSKDITIQTDNMSMLGHRILRQSDLIPNTINYYVVIDSISGLYFGQVTQHLIPTTALHEKLFDERKPELVSSEATVDILGFEKYGTAGFKLPGFSRPGIAEKVYLASPEVIECYLSSIEADTSTGGSKSNVDTRIRPFAHLSSFDNVALELTTSTLFNHHLLVVGSTNTGKSTSALSILDGLVAKNKKIVLIDSTGEYKNSFPRCKRMKRLTLGKNAVIRSGALSISTWSKLFECNESTQGSTLYEAIRSLRYQHKVQARGILQKAEQPVNDIQTKLAKLTAEDTDFDINLLAEQVMAEAVDVSKALYSPSPFRANSYEWLRQRIQNKFDNTSFREFFGKVTKRKQSLTAVLDKFIATPEMSLYIDASEIGSTDEVGGMVVDLISNYLLNNKQTTDDNLSFVLFADEVHRYTRKNTESDVYYSGLTSVAREGRKKGIFLFLTTQNPNDVAPELLGQVGTFLIHRLTHQKELEAIRNVVSEDSLRQVKKLNQGEAILASVNLLEDLHISVDACNRIHDNRTPLY